MIQYYKTLCGKDITPKDAVLIALDTPKAAALAKDILFTAKDGWRNWYNCATKLSLPAEIAIIQKLNK